MIRGGGRQFGKRLKLLEDLRKERKNGQSLLDRCEDKDLADRIRGDLKLLDAIILEVESK